MKHFFFKIIKYFGKIENLNCEFFLARIATTFHLNEVNRSLQETEEDYVFSMIDSIDTREHWAILWKNSFGLFTGVVATSNKLNFLLHKTQRLGFTENITENQIVYKKLISQETGLLAQKLFISIFCSSGKIPIYNNQVITHFGDSIENRKILQLMNYNFKLSKFPKKIEFLNDNYFSRLPIQNISLTNFLKHYNIYSDKNILKNYFNNIENSTFWLNNKSIKNEITWINLQNYQNSLNDLKSKTINISNEDQFNYYYKLWEIEQSKNVLTSIFANIFKNKNVY